jgi:virginiamycin B lyase
MTKLCLWASTSLLVIVVVLTAHAQGPAPRGGGGRGGAVTLPEGPGRASIEAYCSRCHALSLIVNSGGYTHEGWEQLFGTMIAVPKEQATVLADYLAKNFPEQPRPPAVVIPGSVTVSFRNGTFQRSARDRTIHSLQRTARCGTGMFANVLGRVDVKTGQIKEFRCPTPQSGPHGLTADRDGNIWFTANSKGYIGKLDRTGDVKVQLPRRSPAHAAVRSKGVLWFSVQGANLVGGSTRRTARSKSLNRRRRAPTRMGWSSVRPVCRSLSSSDRTRSWRSIR